MPEKPLRSSTLLLLFFVSGLSALVYEVVWARLLGYVTGNSVYSVATVLATFMGGLALGSYWGGRRAPRLDRPILGYARLEIGIGLAGLVVPFAIDALVPVYRFLASVTGAEPDSAGLLVTRFVLSAIVLLVPTTLMGMTLPYLTRAVADRLDRIGLSVGSLYGANTFGAFAGALVAGFAFIPLLGMFGATVAAAVLNALVAAAAFAIDRRVAPIPAGGDMGTARAAETAAPPVPADARPKGGAGGKSKKSEKGSERVTPAAEALPPAPIPRAARTLLVVAFGVAGAASMIDQVAWTRVFSLIVGPTTYAFTLMVSAFILGLGLGGFLGGLVIDRVRDRLSAFAGIEALVGLASLALVPILGQLPFRLVQPLYLAAADMGFGAAQFRVFAILFGLLVVPTTLMGFAFPLVARVVVEDLRSAPRSVGVAYAGNTIGAILGSLAAGFVLVPLIGLQKSLFAAAFLNAAAAAIGLAARAMIRPRSVLSFLPAAALPAFLLVAAIPAWNPNALSSGLYLYAAERAAQFEGENVDIEEMMSVREQLFYREGVTTTVNVERDPNGGALYLRVTGKTDASTTDDMRTQLLLAHVPALLHPEPKDALVIGLGSGVTLGAMLRYPSVKSVDCVEIAAEVVEASDFFGPWNEEFRKDPRQRIVLEDARNFLLLTDRRYDLVTSEPSNPWIAGVGTLFTREFFELGRERLLEGGLFCQWISLLKMDLPDFRSVVRTFTDVFPESTLFTVNSGVDYLLVGAKGSAPPRFEWSRALETFGSDSIVRHRDLLGVPDPTHLLLTYVASGAELRSFGASGEVITDDHNALEISMARNLYRRVPKLALTSALSDLVSDPANVVDGSRLDPERRAALDDAVARARGALRLLATATRDTVDLAENPPGDEATVAERYEGIKRDLEAVLDKFPLAFDAGESLVGFYNDEGRQLLQVNQIEEALAAFRRAVAAKPSDRTARRALAQIESVMAENDIAAGRYDAAIERLTAAQSHDPENTDVSLALADCFGRQGKNRERVRELERARAVDPENFEIICSLAEGLFAIGSSNRAIGFLDDLEKAHPRDPRVLQRIGIVYHRVSEMMGGDKVPGERAIVYYVKALQIDPEYLEPHHNLAVLYFQTETYGKSRAIAEKLLEIAPDYPKRAQILYLLARVCSLLGDKAGAIRYLETLLSAGGKVTRRDLETEPAFEPLRQDPAFLRVVEALGK